MYCTQKLIILHDTFCNLSRTRLCLSTLSATTYNHSKHVHTSQSIRLNASSITTEIEFKLNSRLIILHGTLLCVPKLSRTRPCLSTLSYNTYNNVNHVQRSILICFNEARIKMVIKSELNSNYMHLYGNLQKELILYIGLVSDLDTHKRLWWTLSYNSTVAGINSKHMEP